MGRFEDEFDLQEDMKKIKMDKYVNKILDLKEENEELKKIIEKKNLELEDISIYLNNKEVSDNIKAKNTEKEIEDIKKESEKRFGFNILLSVINALLILGLILVWGVL